MSDQDHDPWASLADSLGATPSKEPERPAAARPQPPAQKPRQQGRPKPAAASGDWDQLASELGVSGGSESAPPARRPAPSPEPVARPTVSGGDEPRGERRRDDRPPRRFDDERPARRDDDRPAGEARGEGRPESREVGDESGERGEGRGRRRRGRRGGRGRGRREGDRVGGEAETVRRGDGPGDDVRHRDDRGPSLSRPETDRAGDDWGGDAAIRDDRGPDRDERRAEVTADGDDREGGPPRTGDRDDDDRPRRRRRRGRRGGRGRSRSGDAGADRGESTGDRSGSRETVARGADDLDDEPLPTSYGMRPAAPRQESDRGERTAKPREGDEAGGDGSGRRRRRRRGGEGRSRGDREASGSRESGQGRSRSRGSRRGSSESRSSSFSRGRRDDFAPVAGRHDEDDEGLEFLGVEEAGQEPRRQRAPEDEDILVESGLNTVLDVPSWVEAIGIVIAGNLDARNRGRGGDRNR